MHDAVNTRVNAYLTVLTVNVGGFMQVWGRFLCTGPGHAATVWSTRPALQHLPATRAYKAFAQGLDMIEVRVDWKQGSLAEICASRIGYSSSALSIPSEAWPSCEGALESKQA